MAIVVAKEQDMPNTHIYFRFLAKMRGKWNLAQLKL